MADKPDKGLTYMSIFVLLILTERVEGKMMKRMRETEG